MVTNFPTSADTYTHPLPTDPRSGGTSLSSEFSDIQDAVTALETKVGVNSDPNPDSFDFKLSEVASGDKVVSKTSIQTLSNKTLTSPKINVGADAIGDMYYRDGTGLFQRLPAGANNTIIQFTGGIPTVVPNPSASNADTVTRGVVQEASQADSDAGTPSGSTGARLFVNPSTSHPVGSMMMYAGATSPTAWVLCDGSSLARAGTYANLFAVIGTVYGAVDGTHFNVPDMRGRTPIGVGTGTGGGASGTGLPTGGSALTAVARGTWNGEETHQLTVPELASHSHTFTVWSGGSTTTNFARAIDGLSATPYTPSTASTGSDTPHNNIQPVMGVNFIIRY